MNITLYEAASAVRALLEMVDPETGEMPEGFDQARAIVATKAQAVAAFVLENDAQADMVEAHAKALMDRVKAARKRSSWLRQYLQSHMDAAGISEIKSDDGTFRARLERQRDESVDVYEPALLPADFMRVKTSQEPDKAAIKKAIAAGQDVPGAVIVRKDRLTLK